MRLNRPCTDDEFEKMRDLHVPWELLMLRSAATILSEPPPDDADAERRLRRWMAIEGFYIHVRTLDAFFFGEDKGRDRDAFAVHFLGDPGRWKAVRPQRSAEMQKAVLRAGTMVAHLSYDRQTAIDSGERLEWLRLAEEMNAVWIAFRDAMKDARAVLPMDDGFLLLPERVFDVAVSYGSETTVSTPCDISQFIDAFLPKS